jgi:gamma-glutamylcyclotransferase (GGCT)/AIG2-like uncharacterized protein YtfP
MPADRTTLPRDGLPRRLFCYGTLQLPTVLEAVIGRRLRGERAMLSGYGAFQVHRAEYPGLLRLPGHTTHGVLYHDLTPLELDVLDRFEGALYQRRQQPVRLANGRRVKAWVYRVAAGRRQQLTTVPWHLERFRRSTYPRFMQRFVKDRRDLYVSR